MPSSDQQDNSASCTSIDPGVPSPTIMPGLLRLPNEILCHITREFNHIEDFSSFRLVCRDVSRAVLPEVVRVCFGDRSVMLHQGPSLERLIPISCHPDFGPAVKTLDVSLSHWPRFPSRSAWETAVLDQQAHDVVLEDQFLAESGLGTTYLAQAIAKLPSLKTVRIQSEGAWEKGAEAVSQQTGVYRVLPGDLRADFELDMHAVRRVLVALFANRSTSVNELCLHFDIQPSMLAFMPPAKRHIGDRPPFSNISHLELWVPTSEQRGGEGVANLSSFVALFPGLQRLTLSFCGYFEDDFRSFPEFVRTVRLQGLRSLHIRNVENCTEDELLELMRQHKDGLEEIYFEHVNIAKECGSWKQLLATVRDEALVRVLGMRFCTEGDELIQYRQFSRRGAVRYLVDFIIGRGGRKSWTRAIDGLLSPEADSEAEEGPEAEEGVGAEEGPETREWYYPDPYLNLAVWI